MLYHANYIAHKTKSCGSNSFYPTLELKTLLTSPFMDKYGSSVLEKYDLDDLDDADKTEFLDDDEDMEEDNESEYMTGVIAEVSLQEITTSSQLIEHLSEESVIVV